MDKKTMSQEAAFEMDSFLPLMNAGLAALNCVVDKYLSTGDSLNARQVIEMGDAMMAVDLYLKGLHDEARARTDKAFASMQRKTNVKERAIKK